MQGWILKNTSETGSDSGNSDSRRRLLFRLLFWFLIAVSLIPVALSFYEAFFGSLGARPIERILHRSGTWALNFLLITLSLSPLSRLPGLGFLKRYRRMAGLFSFFYASLHLAIYLGLDQLLDWGAIAKDITRHRRIYVGILAYLMLLPLAVTSTNRWVKRMGFQKWKRLHSLVFPAALAGSLHYILLVKKDISGPMVYAALTLALVALRIPLWISRFQNKKGGGGQGLRR